ncbi:MAG TPA: signal peptide peptidase SppA [Vicinamibacteria bacterium]|nr:signal peptide peptidase SppA [Vicinamibacteria bacterium]
MKRRTAFILAAGVAAVAIGAAAVGAVALLVRGGRPTTGWTGGAGYLALDVDGELPEEPASGFSSFFGTRPPSIRGLVEAVDRAGRDPSVKGLVLRVGGMEAGWGRVQELRDALVRFRRTGKPSWAHLEFAGNLEYLLATACTKIAASPTTTLDVSGLAAEVTFYRGTLDKLGVQAQFEGVGKYKNAPNQFTETGFTPPHREQMEALVGDLFEQYVHGVSEGRGLAPEAVRSLIDRGPFTAAEAKAAGLVDELLYRDEVEARIPASTRLDPGRYVKGARGFGLDGRPKVALVYAVGDIVPGESQASPFGGGLVGSDTVIRGLRQARQDDSVRAIVLRVDSPGGSGTASDAVWREVALARRAKPVVASMGDYAASGGYYLAMGADAIVAEPGTITGSIGVFSGKFSLRGLYGKLGISQETVRRGRHATLFSSSEPWTDEERAKVRELNRAFYETFVTKAAQGRKRTAGEIDAVAQGRVWTGAQALGAGLVDALGGLDAAVRVARDRARIAKGQEVQLLVLPRKKGFLETLVERQDEDVLAPAVGPRAAAFLRWATALSDRGPIARVPFDLAVR